MLQKPFRKRAFLDPWFFCEFICFFDDFLILPRSPKNAKTPAIWRILLKNHFSPNWKSPRCKNAPKCRRERRFLGWFSKNIERGGVGGTGSTPGSKLALATSPARHRRIHIIKGLRPLPPTPEKKPSCQLHSWRRTWPAGGMVVFVCMFWQHVCCCQNYVSWLLLHLLLLHQLCSLCVVLFRRAPAGFVWVNVLHWCDFLMWHEIIHNYSPSNSIHYSPQTRQSKEDILVL